MATAEVNSKSLFRPQRYPALNSIVREKRGESRSLAEIAGELLLAEIIQGELLSGTRLKTTEVGERLGMSRTPISKALAKLTSEGILNQENNHQAIVSTGAADWLAQIHELRQLLEPNAAWKATGNIPQEVLDDLLLLSRDAKPTSKHDWSEAAQFFDFALHLAIAEFCQNRPMKVSICRCWTYKRLSYDLSDGCRAGLKLEYAQHVSILGALIENDADKAREEMAAHLDSTIARSPSNRVV